MRNRDSCAQLRAELRQDREFIHRNSVKNKTMFERITRRSDADEYDYAALGYTLHNLYNSYESYFSRIAKFFENNLDQTEWHKALIERMTLEISGVRPALFDYGFGLRVEELLKFRHVFRNLYKTPLIPEKVLFAQKSAEGLDSDFDTRHLLFDKFLEDLQKELGD